MNSDKNIIDLKAIEAKLNQFKGISLVEMEEVSLMKRTDTKFVINISFLNFILEQLKENYKVLEVKNKRIMNYSSLYLDTPKFKFYNDHHNGKVNRTKIRQRKYVDSNLTFLEIKQKNGKGETNKSRVKIDDFQPNLNQELKNFIFTTTKENYKLLPSLWNNFRRITLVNLKDNERVTIDLELTYSFKSKEKSYKNIVIVELKQTRFNRNSDVVKALKKYNYNPYSFSKYCIGMVNLYENIKYNLFKNKLLKINKISM